MHHRHGVLDGDRLPLAVLHVQLGAPQAGEQVGLLAHQQMSAVELGADVHAQVQLAHGREALGRVGQRHGEVAAQADQRFRRAGDHRLHGLYRIMPMFCRRLEAQYLLDLAEEFG
ncbi:hypothetical protein D3C72_1379980 [compost metagenome]